MKILVTGANGYLGQGVTKVLCDKGEQVIATGHSSEFIDSRAEIKDCDLFSIENPFDYFEKPDVVLHLAWKDGFKHASLTHINDLSKHYLFLTKLIDSGIKQVCVVGSMHEIGFWEGSINESTPCNPLSLYGIAKNALRQSIEIQKKTSDFVFQWIRGYYIVGNAERGCSIFSKITQAAKEGKSTFPFTLGLNQFDFIDYEKMCHQIAAVVRQNKVSGIINCCSGRPEKLADRVERYIKENNYLIKLEYGAFPDRPYDSKAVWGDDKKIREILALEGEGL